MRLSALLLCVVSSTFAAMTPASPSITARAHILMDYDSGKVLAGENTDQTLGPASLAKIMSMYVVDRAYQNGQIKLDDKVKISEQAWRTEGSRMFVDVNSEVSVRDLIQGVIVHSGNDAVTALAEHVAGSVDSFTDLMNSYAKKLGLKNTHFTDPMGWPNKDQYTTAEDLAILSRAVIRDMSPELYAFNSQKWFTYNNIKQPNRNRLLWRDANVDGLKSGHTEESGWNLVATRKKDNMRLISVILGAKDDATRADESYRLLTYGSRFFETHKIYAAHEAISQPRVWMGQVAQVNAGSFEPIYVTIPNGTSRKLKTNITINPKLTAPLQAGDQIGVLTVQLGDEVIQQTPIVSLQTIERGGMWSRMKDYVSLNVSGILNKNT